MSTRIFTPRPKDFYTEVRKGNVPGHSLVHKFGRNDASAAATWELVSQISGAVAFPTAAGTVQTKAGGNLNDDSGGTGAREVMVEGLDSTGAVVTEAYTTNGVLASGVGSQTFRRTYRAWVSSSGTYGGANVGTVTITNSTSSTDHLIITAGEGQTQYGAYTIPLGKTGYLLSVFVNVDAAKAADFRVMTREDMLDSSAPVASPRIKLYFDGVVGTASLKPVSPILTLSALTDIWVEAKAGAGGAEVSCDFEILLVDD